MTQFLKPKFALNQDTSTDYFMEFSVNNLERGFGRTLGNTLRRALIEVVPGISIYAIRIKGVHHEFSTIDGVIENVSEIILNVKNIVIGHDIDDNHDEDLQSLTLSISGESEVTAGDIECPTGIEIINKDLVIAHTTSRNVLFEMELFIKKSRGYSSFEDNKRLISNSLGIIAIDSDYCPIKKVTFHVEPITKTIKGIDYEKLIFVLETNGSIDPATAVAFAARILNAYFDLFISLKESVRNFEVIDSSDSKENNELLNTPIEDLALNARSYHSLKNEGIKTLGEIAEKTSEQIAAIKNLGKKSIQEIEEMLASKGLFLARKL